MASRSTTSLLEAFDARTGFALWWVRLYGRQPQAEVRAAMAGACLVSRTWPPSVTWCLMPTRASGSLPPTSIRGKIHGDSAVIDVVLALAAASEEGLRGDGPGAGCREAGSRRRLPLGNDPVPREPARLPTTLTPSRSPGCSARGTESGTQPRLSRPTDIRALALRHRTTRRRGRYDAQAEHVHAPTPKQHRRTAVTSVTPWWKALKMRKEILGASGQIDEVRMSLFRAVHGMGADRPPYADARYYGEITHPTERLIDLLTEIAVRIGGGDDYLKARAVTRLDQGMGGGKSHACIGAYHLAANPEGTAEHRTRAAGRRPGARPRWDIPLPPTSAGPHVVVLPCDNMTPGRRLQELDGPAVSLYERFLWRLFSKDYSLYERYQPFWSDKHKIAEAHTRGQPARPHHRRRSARLHRQRARRRQQTRPGRPGHGFPARAARRRQRRAARGDAGRDDRLGRRQDRAVGSRPGTPRRPNSLLERNGIPATVTEVGDFADILRRTALRRRARRRGTSGNRRPLRARVRRQGLGEARLGARSAPTGANAGATRSPPATRSIRC